MDDQEAEARRKLDADIQKRFRGTLLTIEENGDTGLAVLLAGHQVAACLKFLRDRVGLTVAEDVALAAVSDLRSEEEAWH